MARKDSLNPLFLWLLCLLLVAMGCDSEPVPKVEKGLLDLRGFSLESTSYLNLDGTWAFHWDTLVPPTEVPKRRPEAWVNTPGAWNKAQDLDGVSYPANARVTYHARILTDERTSTTPWLALQTRTIRHAFVLYVNGDSVTSNGKVLRHGYEDHVLPRLVRFPRKDTLDVVLHIANEGFFEGGIVEPLLLGEPDQLERVIEQRANLNALLLGGLLIIGLYHIILYYLVKGNMNAFHFGLMCILIGLRSGLTGEYILVDALPWLPTGLHLRIEFGALYFAPLLVAVFFRRLYPEEFPRWLLIVCMVISGVLLVATLLPSPYWYGAVLPLGQLQVVILGPILVFYTLLKATWRKKPEAFMFLVAFVIFLSLAINDILYSLHVVQTGFLVSWGVIGWILIQAAALAIRFVRAIAEVEDLRVNLERKILERTFQLQERTNVLEVQKEEIEEKHHDIQSSLHYAHRIQQAVLGDEPKLQRIFPKAFIFFQPREIVSGDFYWFGHLANVRILIIGDSQDKGIPGAFITVLCNSLLNQSLLEKQLLDPKSILKELDQRLQETLHSQVGNHSYHGLDIGVLMLDEATNKGHFSGARIGLMHFQQGEVKRYGPVRESIGIAHTTKRFVQHTFAWEAKDRFYVFTHGMGNQIGGDQEQPFTTTQVRGVIQKHQSAEFAEQKQILQDKFDDWKGLQTQTDDVLIVGVEA
ncbi:MAG: 7TM diverse intracellular signaling domain-containing protein [Bacteroidota bacterium]